MGARPGSQLRLNYFQGILRKASLAAGILWMALPAMKRIIGFGARG